MTEYAPRCPQVPAAGGTSGGDGNGGGDEGGSSGGREGGEGATGSAGSGGKPTEARVVSKRELHALLTTSGPHLRHSVGDKVMGKWGGVRGGQRWLPAEVVAVGAQHFDLKYNDDGQIEYNVCNPSQPLGPNPGSDHYPGPD